jgi:thiol-disulfide isomerase/thioredoxin
MRTLRKTLVVLVSLGAGLLGIGYALYLGNRAPTVGPIPPSEIATPGRPYVVKLHAQWCPVCMVTKDVWAQIEQTYAGRVNLLVLDFTNQATTDASRIEATRLGLESFFDEYEGATGTVVVLTGATRQVTASIGGSRDFADYRAAIDAALTDAKSPTE